MSTAHAYGVPGTGFDFRGFVVGGESAARIAFPKRRDRPDAWPTSNANGLLGEADGIPEAPYSDDALTAFYAIERRRTWIANVEGNGGSSTFEVENPDCALYLLGFEVDGFGPGNYTGRSLSDEARSAFKKALGFGYSWAGALEYAAPKAQGQQVGELKYWGAAQRMLEEQTLAFFSRGPTITPGVTVVAGMPPWPYSFKLTLSEDDTLLFLFWRTADVVMPASEAPKSGGRVEKFCRSIGLSAADAARAPEEASKAIARLSYQRPPVMPSFAHAQQHHMKSPFSHAERAQASFAGVLKTILDPMLAGLLYGLPPFVIEGFTPFLVGDSGTAPMSLSHLRSMIVRKRAQYENSDFGGEIPTGDAAAKLLTARILGEGLTAAPLTAFRNAVDAGGAWSAGLAAAAPLLTMTPDYARAWNAQVRLETEAIAHFAGPPPYAITIPGTNPVEVIDFAESMPAHVRSVTESQARTLFGLSAADAQQAGERVEYNLAHPSAATSVVKPAAASALSFAQQQLQHVKGGATKPLASAAAQGVSQVIQHLAEGVLALVYGLPPFAMPTPSELAQMMGQLGSLGQIIAGDVRARMYRVEVTPSLRNVAIDYVGDVPPPNPNPGGGIFGPTAAAQACFDDYKARWLTMSGWTAYGPITKKFYTFRGMPQFETRWTFWEPWAQAWEAGNPDVTMLVAQRANLNGAELDAKVENENMRRFNAWAVKENAEKGTTYPLMQLIPMVDGSARDAPGVADSTPALQAAAVVDQAAKDAARHISELGSEAVPYVALGLLGLGGLYLATRRH